MTLAIFTLLYNTSYLPGSLLLGSIVKEMLQEFGLDIKLGVLIDKLVFSEPQIDLIMSVYDELIDLLVIESKLTDKLVNELKRPELDKTFSKIQLWSLYQYEKVLYLDSDTLPNKESNLLDLFKVEFDKGKILASPDSGFPDIFNSGVFLLKPNQQDYNNLYNLVSSGGDISFDGADQGLLNQYFNSNPDWVGELINRGKSDIKDASFGNWIKLPFLYNVTPSTQYQYLPAYNYFTSSQFLPFEPLQVQAINPPVEPNPKDIDQSEQFAKSSYEYTAKSHFHNQVKLIHFIGPYKPWNYPHTSQHLEWWLLWYKYFDQSTLDVVKSNGTPKSVGSLQIESKVETSFPKVYTYTSKDSMWDATTSSPPKGSSTPEHLFNPEPHVNTWDKPSPPKVAHKKKSVKFQSVEDLEKPSKYGFHWNQKPERLFDSQFNYSPTHAILSKSSNPIRKPIKPVEPDPPEHSYSKGVDAQQVQNKLEKLVVGKSSNPHKPWQRTQLLERTFNDNT